MTVPQITHEQVEAALQGSDSDLELLLREIHPADCASLIREFDLDDQIRILSSAHPEKAGDILSEIQGFSSAEEFILTEKLPFDFLVEMIGTMPSDNAVDTLNICKPSMIADILSRLSPEKSEALEEMLRYGEETAGGLMTDDCLQLQDSTTVSNAISQIKKMKKEEEVLHYHYIYITDDEERLVGYLPIVDLLVHPDSTPIKDVMIRDPLSVNADIDQEQVANMFAKYDLDVLPVINRGKRLIGRITVDDVIDVIKEEADEDFYKLVGTDDTEKETPSSIKIASIRLPWLLSTLIGSFLASTVIKLFSGHVKEFVALFFFMPVITAMSGNIGVQCSTVIVRGLATGFVKLGYARSILLKELKIGLIIALTCSVVAGLCSYFFIEHNVKLGFTVGVSMLACVVFASSSGTAVPLILKRLGFDPAISSGPIITTFNDITGLLIYFTIATVILL